MSASGSTKVIIISFAANIGIAAAKFVGAFISGSASLLAEAIHSLVDCSNQVFLLIGNKKSKRAPDEDHPLGYGREAFFWSFIVAILLFSLGGLFAIYEGAHKLHGEDEVSSPIIGMIILIFSVALEGYSLWTCLKEIKAQNKNNLWHWFRNTKSSELLVLFTENAAALVGLAIATVFLGLAWMTGHAYWDAVGSIVVGAVLVVVAVLLAVEIKSFIIGEAPSSDLRLLVEKTAKQFFPTGRLLRYIAIQTGTDEIMMSCKIHPGDMKDLSLAIDTVNKFERQMKTNYPSLKWQFIELDHLD